MGFWEAFHQGGGHQELRHLGLMYFQPASSDLEAMVRGIAADVPRLECLTLSLYYISKGDLSEVVPRLHWDQWLTKTLGNLKNSPKLLTIELEEDDFTSKDFLD